MQKKKRWDCRDPKLACGSRFLVGIELEQSNLRFQLLRRLVEHRRHDAARSTPWRPNIHQNREIAFALVFFETRSVDAGRMTMEKWITAGPTMRGQRRFAGRQFVGLSAVRA